MSCVTHWFRAGRGRCSRTVPWPSGYIGGMENGRQGSGGGGIRHQQQGVAGEKFGIIGVQFRYVRQPGQRGDAPGVAAPPGIGQAHPARRLQRLLHKFLLESSAPHRPERPHAAQGLFAGVQDHVHRQGLAVPLDGQTDGIAHGVVRRTVSRSLVTETGWPSASRMISPGCTPASAAPRASSTV